MKALANVLSALLNATVGVLALAVMLWVLVHHGDVLLSPPDVRAEFAAIADHGRVR